MRLTLLILCMPTLLIAAPMAGLSPTPHYHLETAGNIQLSSVSAGLSGLGRLGIAPNFDAGISLGFRAGDITGLTVGIPARMGWLKQSETNGIARLSSDLWVAVTQASPDLLTELSATVSAAHHSQSLGMEFRLSSGAIAVAHDKTDLRDTMRLYPIILGGVGVKLIEGWSSSIEAGLSNGYGLFNLEASIQF
jgi:hypothetical protein